MEIISKDLIENEISNKILRVAIKVHSNLGPGLLESAYKECLAFALKEEGLHVLKEKLMPLVYNGIELDSGYRIDLLIEDKVVVEIKAVEGINEVHLAQVLTYLKLGNYKLGLLLNFNVKLLKYGVRRVVNRL